MADNFLQGAPLPNVTETTTEKQTTPQGYTTYLEDLAKSGTTAMARKGADLVAGYDPLQSLGYNQLPQAAQSYQPGLTAAGVTASQAAQGITPERIQALMNPYTTNVVNEMARLSQQNVERNLLPGMKAGFVSTGGLGSQRYAGALGQSMADVQSNLTGLQQKSLESGYQSALKGALDEAQLRNLAAKTQADIAKSEQDLALTGAGALTKAGAERQKYEQSKLDAPLAIATQAANLMKGQQLPTDLTKTFTGPRTRDYYQQSPFGKVAGVLSLIGGATQGKEMEGLSKILGLVPKLGTAGQGVIQSLLDPSRASSAAVGEGEMNALKEAGLLDEYNKLIQGLQSDFTNYQTPEDVAAAYENLFGAIGEDQYFTGV